jgi:hypothetical protein
MARPPELYGLSFDSLHKRAAIENLHNTSGGEPANCRLAGELLYSTRPLYVTTTAAAVWRLSASDVAHNSAKRGATMESLCVVRTFVGSALVIAVCWFANGHANAETITERFGAPGAPGFHPFFLHSLTTPPKQNDFWEFTDQQLPPDPGNYSLFLAPASDRIRFDTAPGQFVDFATITLTDYCGLGCTSVTFTGAAGAKEFKNSIVGAAQSFSTAGLNLGQIREIVLASAEGTFDNLQVNVVPEPSTVLLALPPAAAIFWTCLRVLRNSRRAC